MLKIISKNGEWDIEIEGTIYNFYYSDSKPIEGLILNGCDEQQEEYKIGDYLVTGMKEKCIHSESGYRYALQMKQTLRLD